MMLLQKQLFTIASAALLAGAAPATNVNLLAPAAAACTLLRASTNAHSAYPGSLQYNDDVSHWSNASSLPSLCSARPATPQDIQELFEIIRETRTPWAVKGAGHCNNNNMSSTIGLQIAMSEFDHIDIAADKKSVKIGAGLQWGQVYSALAPHGLAAVGGRLTSVGVAGLLLSSGYSWLTNQYGFAIDNILSVDVVLPNGTFTTVSETHGSDIFYALQGGVNNFGIATSFTVKTYPIGRVWGGMLLFPADKIDALINATAEYSTNGSLDDPKAIFVSQLWATNGTVTGGAILLYDGPTPPAGLFDMFLNVPGIGGEVKTFDNFSSFAHSVEDPADAHNRATWYSSPILTWTRELLETIAELTKEYSIKAARQSRSMTLVTNDLDPFGRRAYSFNRGSAWPHGPSNPYNTFTTLFQWSDPRDDQIAVDLTLEYHAKVWEKAVELGVSRPRGEAFFPPNYSQGTTPLDMIYGANLPWLKEVKKRVDPYDIISLTGGFKI